MNNPKEATNQQDNSTDHAQFDVAETTYKTSHTAVRKARRFAMQGLYEWLMTDHRFTQEGRHIGQENAPHDIAARTRAENAMHTVHLGYYHDMMRDIPADIEALDALISTHLDRDITLLDPIEHAILLVGTYELKYRLEVPYKVVLDEAMKLNTHFGATDAHKLINAVLDKLAPTLRELEVNAENTQNSTKTDSDNETTDTKGDITQNDDATNTSASTDLLSTESLAGEATSNDSNEDIKPKPRIGRDANKKGTTVRRNANIKATSTKPKAPDTPTQVEEVTDSLETDSTSEKDNENHNHNIDNDQSNDD